MADHEWWESLRDRWLALLGREPGRLKKFVVANVVAVLAVVVASASVDGFGRGVHVWLPCVAMLFGWLVLTPTKTVRWVSVLRLFSISALWALVVGAISMKLAGSVDLAVRDPGPSIGIAAMVEETMKLAPLAVLGVLAPGRIRRFAAVDWILVGLACGMGFQAREDFLRQATSRPSTFAFSPGDGWHYGWSLFGGRFDIGDVASYPGHHVETALVAAGVGLAVRFGSRARPCLWALPVLLWLVVVCDHAGFNAALADEALFTSGRSTVPTFLHSVWSWTGHGFHRGWLLVVLVVLAAIADARAQVPDADRPTRPTPVHRAGSATVVERAAAVVDVGVRAMAGGVARSGRAARGGWNRSTGSGRARAVTVLAVLAAERRRREVEGAPFRPGRPWLPTRALVGVVGTLGIACSVLMGRSVAAQIGDSLRPSPSAWLAGLLDALGGWWDGMGPGGQGMVVVGGLALLLLGGWLLLPELLGSGLVVEGGLIVVGGTTAGTSTVAVPTLIAGTALLTMAAVGSHASTGGDGDGPDDPDQARLNELARDPSQGGKITEKTLHEARIGLDLETSGRLSGLRRDPTGGAEFIDDAGQAWDIKGFNSEFPNGYSKNDAIGLIEDSIQNKENVILDTTKMSPEHITELRLGVEKQASLVGKVIWWP